VEYFDSKEGSVENGSKLIALGEHHFRIRLTDAIGNYSLNNSTCFNVNDFVAYHRSLTFDLSMYEALFVSLLLLIFINTILRKSDLLQNKPKFTRYLFIPILLLTHICLYYYYFYYDYYYKNMIPLESAVLVITFLLFIYYIFCVGDSCTAFNGSELFKAAIGMFISVIIFNYFLPDILSQKIVYSGLLAVLLYSLHLILKNRDKIAATIIPANKSNGRFSLIGIIVAQIAIISCAIYLIMLTVQPISFKPSPKLLDLLIIEIMEGSLLITVLTCGLHPDRLSEILKSEVSKVDILKSKLFG
jgi:hypothetical protein